MRSAVSYGARPAIREKLKFAPGEGLDYMAKHGRKMSGCQAQIFCMGCETAINELVYEEPSRVRDIAFDYVVSANYTHFREDLTIIWMDGVGMETRVRLGWKRENVTDAEESLMAGIDYGIQCWLAEEAKT